MNLRQRAGPSRPDVANACRPQDGPYGRFKPTWDTAGLQIEVLTPGAGYITDSGQSYAAMVPEPSSTAMLGLGTLTLLMLARRRRLESGN